MEIRIEQTLHLLQDTDAKKAYALTREICAASTDSDEYYAYFGDFAGLFESAGPFVRIRGVMICCAQAKWDTEGKLACLMPKIGEMLRVEKAAAVRQILAALQGVAEWRPELRGAILDAVSGVDAGRYKESIRGLVEKDLEGLMHVLK